MCIFCQIAEGKIPSDKLYQDDELLAFRDINPQAPVHILIIPKKHVVCIADITREDEALLGNIVRVANKLAIEEGISETGIPLSAFSASSKLIPKSFLRLSVKKSPPRDRSRNS